jgi:lysophospholipase L1-like esterase
MERDVLTERPDWLSVMIGINDVWHGFDGNPDGPVPLDEYENAAVWLIVVAVASFGGGRTATRRR